MSNSVNQMSAPDAAFYYDNIFGYGITSWPKGKNLKAPKRKGWQKAPVDSEKVREGHQLGILHGPSNTLMVDVDDEEKGIAKLRELGLDPDEWDEDLNVGLLISGSGKPKYLFRMPKGHDYGSRTYKDKDGQTILEFRTGHGQMDLLPPSLHPSGERYKWEGEFPTKLAPVPPKILAELPGKNRRKTTSPTGDARERPPVEKVRAVVDLIPNGVDVGYDDWFRIGCAIHWSTNGSVEGLDLFHSWGQRCGKYEGDVTNAKWDSMGRYDGAAVTFGTLCDEARKANPEAYAEVRERFRLSPQEDFSRLKRKVRTSKGMQRNELTEALDLQTLSEVEPKPTEWLIANMIPLGEISVLAAQGGTGKSTLRDQWASRGSRGKPLIPDTEPPDGPFKTLIVTVEDSLEKTIKPRVLAAGGDADMITVLGTTREGSLVNIDQHIEQITEAFRRDPGYRLLVIDPITSHLTPDRHFDSNKADHVNSALNKLTNFCKLTGAAVLLISHFRKGSNSGGKQNSYDMVLGSTAFVTRARVVMKMVRDPSDEHRSVVVGPFKSNLGKTNLHHRYEIHEATVDGGIKTVQMKHQGECQGSVDEYLGHHDQKHAIRLKPPTAQERLRKWCEENLSDVEWVDGNLMSERATKDLDMPMATFRKQRSKLRELGYIIKKKQSDGSALWRLASLEDGCNRSDQS